MWRAGALLDLHIRMTIEAEHVHHMDNGKTIQVGTRFYILGERTVDRDGIGVVVYKMTAVKTA
jgi:hypothetical protein